MRDFRSYVRAAVENCLVGRQSGFSGKEIDNLTSAVINEYGEIDNPGEQFEELVEYVVEDWVENYYLGLYSA